MNQLYSTKLSKGDQKIIAEARKQAASFMGLAISNYQKSTEQLNDARKTAGRCVTFIIRLKALEVAFKTKYGESLIGENTLEQIDHVHQGVNMFLDGFDIADVTIAQDQDQAQRRA